MLTADQILADPLRQYPSATVACFDPTRGDLPRRELDPSRTVEFLNRLQRAGAEAVLIGASTGQGHLRTADELKDWFRAAGQLHNGQLCLMALLRPEDGPAAVREMAEQVASDGYGVAFVRPGTGLPANADTDQIVANMRPAVEAIAGAGLAVGVYSIPDVSGVPLSPDAVAALRETPGGESIVAVKVTEADYESSTARFLSDERLTDLKIVQGWDTFIARALRDGGSRCGITSGPMSFAVFQYLHILNAAKNHDWESLESAQQPVTRLFQAMQDDPAKFADLQRAKYIMGLGQPVTSDVTADQIERVLTAMREIENDADRERMIRSLDLMGDGPFHDQFTALLQSADAP